MDFRDFWYAAALSRDLKQNRVIAAEILGEWIALFRDENGKAVALEDRCLHRCARLSAGSVREGRLQCAYHGWTYDGAGRVVFVPSEGPQSRQSARRCVRTYQVCEVDDYVYVRLAEAVDDSIQPFRIPNYRHAGWGAIRLVNRFRNNVTNCVENFVDIPHTVFVHPKIFRVSRQERFIAEVRRVNGSVIARYRNERGNLGIFSWFLNPGGREIEHTDAFHMPNVTCVDYNFGRRRRFIITSQSVPVADEETIVYTDLTYNYGVWNSIARPIIRWQAQTIINQDIRILGNQMKTIKKYGARFSNTQADIIHVLIESIRSELAKGADPRLLPEQAHEIEFWV
ncbi:MAG TPA: aromatic ring-hydroxylating dioxygenase subunit alpha [Blastocatellia bacterium]|nr:aromatic ring-hydroxylating dioxygenase subunit alpha [Blastocatellia bacterium]